MQNRDPPNLNSFVVQYGTALNHKTAAQADVYMGHEIN